MLYSETKILIILLYTSFNLFYDISTSYIFLSKNISTVQIILLLGSNRIWVSQIDVRNNTNMSDYTDLERNHFFTAMDNAI
jgi:hypothetical protein